MVDENSLDENLNGAPDQALADMDRGSLPDSGKEAPAISGQEVEYVDVLQIRMGGKDFLLAVPDVSEIVRPIVLTPVPMAPDHLLGIGNIHGQIVCVIEPGKILNLPDPPAEDSDGTRFVCLRHARMRVAIRVDAVPAIHRLRKDVVPHAADAADTSHILGHITVEGTDYDVLNTAALLHE